MKVLSIIVSYNFEPWLDKCLDSLFSSRYPTDVIVIDNASQDRTVQMIREKFPLVTLVESKENLGFGKANNIGFDHALQHGYDFVFLINQDAWIHRECLSHLLAHPIQKSTGIVSPLHYDGTERSLDRGFKHYLNNINLKLASSTATFINAAFWLIPISTIKEVGKFSPLFYHYGEDKDYANRLRYHGYKIAVNHQAVAYHDRQSRPERPSGNALQRSEFVYFLTEYANINYSFGKAFGYSVLAAFKKALKTTGKSNGLSFAAYVQIGFSILGHSAAVLKTRDRNRNKRADN